MARKPMYSRRNNMRINHNMMAMNTHRQLGITSLSQSKSMEKLSSGHRINRASDDAAGLSISEKMRGQIRGLNQASRNAQDGISLLQTAEGALNEVSEMLVRVKELYVQKGNTATYATFDEEQIEKEIKSLTDEITNIAKTTNFNGKTLLTGNFTGKIQIGHKSGEQMTMSIGNLAGAIKKLAVSDTSKGITFAKDQAAGLTAVETAIKGVAGLRSDIGALQNRLEHTVDNINTTAENLQASESRVRDVDMAKEMMKFTKDKILTQAAQSMLAQANQNPQGVLSLLR